MVDSNQPYKGLHKDPVRLIVIIVSSLLFTGVPIFYFSVVPFHFWPILYGVILAVFLIALEALIIFLLWKEYKTLNQKK